MSIRERQRQLNGQAPRMHTRVTVEALLRLYYSVTALFRLYEGSIKAVFRLYEGVRAGMIKAAWGGV